MVLSAEKEFRGPFGITIKLYVAAGPVVLVFAGLAALFRWERPAIGLLHAFIDFLTVQRWAIVFFGTTLVSAGFLLGARPQFKKEWRWFIPVGAIAIGIVLVGLALGADSLSPPRFTDASIMLLQVDKASKIRQPLGELIDGLRSKLNDSVEFNQLMVPENGIVPALKKVRRYQYDIVVLDYDEPTQLVGVRFAEMLNPRTLYVLVRPADPRHRLPANVISLAPAVVEEVAALVALVGFPARPVRVVTSGVPRARLAARLLRHALTTEGFAVGPDEEGDFRNLQLVPDQTTVWIGWRPTTLPNGTVIQAPGVIMVEKGGGVDARSIRVSPFLSSTVRADEGWRHNQLLALSAIMDAHFDKSGRPLDIRVSMDAAVELLATLHLATVSREMRLVPRYLLSGDPR